MPIDLSTGTGTSGCGTEQSGLWQGQSSNWHFGLQYSLLLHRPHFFRVVPLQASLDTLQVAQKRIVQRATD
jgi:hypothetical protein